jgi:hypothetical protein
MQDGVVAQGTVDHRDRYQQQSRRDVDEDRVADRRQRD